MASLPQLEKACLSLSTCSIIINSEKRHIPFVQWKFHHQWPFGWSFCRRGPKSCRAPHTFSRSLALFPCLMTVPEILESIYSLTPVALRKPLCGGTCVSLRLQGFTAWPDTCVLSDTHAPPTPAFVSYYAYTSWGFCQVKSLLYWGETTLIKRPLDTAHFKARFSFFGKPAALERAAISSWGGSTKFLERRNRLLFNFCHWAWKSSPPLFII